MNKQEALEWIKSQKAWIDAYEFPEEHQDLYQELLELAVPKKVTREVIGMITHVQCPTCKRVMRHETSGTILRFCTNHKYCSVCGQSLDWSNDEI